MYGTRLVLGILYTSIYEGVYIVCSYLRMYLHPKTHAVCKYIYICTTPKYCGCGDAGSRPTWGAAVSTGDNYGLAAQGRSGFQKRGHGRAGRAVACEIG